MAWLHKEHKEGQGYTTARLPAISFYSSSSSRGAAPAASISTAPWVADLPRREGKTQEGRQVSTLYYWKPSAPVPPVIHTGGWEAGNQNPQAEGICTEQLYLLVRCCQEVASLGATPTAPALPRSHPFSFSSQLWVSRTSLLPMPAELGSFESLLVWHTENHSTDDQRALTLWMTPQQLMSNQMPPQVTWTQSKCGLSWKPCCSRSVVVLTSASKRKTKEFYRIYQPQ